VFGAFAKGNYKIVPGFFYEMFGAFAKGNCKIVPGFFTKYLARSQKETAKLCQLFLRSVWRVRKRKLQNCASFFSAVITVKTN
jgi:hypothetical protein